ncbi:hypothetical protein BGZ96_005102, partial [Linnemannia gamsii]
QLDSLLAGIDTERQIAIRNFFNTIPISVTTPAAPTPSERELEADRRDLARTLAQVLKPQRPTAYSGAIDADACINFIDNQKEYFTVVKLNLTEWVQYTALNLVDDAKSWWRSSGLSIQTPWDTFETDFLTFYTPPNAVAAAREALESLKQVSPPASPRPTLDKGTALHWFVKGLEPDTSKEVKLRQTETLDIAISQATLIHSILFPNGPPAPSNSSTSPKHDPNAMDIDNLHVAIHNLSTQRLHQRSPSQAHSRGKARLTEKGGCFHCRKIDHMANQCRVFPNQRQRPHQFNNIEVADTQAPQAPSQTQSGKANGN